MNDGGSRAATRWATGSAWAACRPCTSPSTRRLERDVAVKLLAEHLAEDPQFVTRFRREAMAAARLVHPNIVQVFDFGLDEPTGRHYIVMEYIRGQSGAEILRDRGHLPVERRSRSSHSCRGLDYAHRNGVVHRDVKPGNLLRSDEGDRQARRLRHRPDRTSESAITQVGSVLGTAAYLAPEQAHGDEADPRADLYGLGVVTYQLLSGRLPYEADSLTELALKQQREAPPLLNHLNPEVTPQLAVAVDRALALDAEDRYASAEEMRAALVDGARGIGPMPEEDSTHVVEVADGADERVAAGRPRHQRPAGRRAPAAAEPPPAPAPVAGARRRRRRRPAPAAAAPAPPAAPRVVPPLHHHAGGRRARGRRRRRGRPSARRATATRSTLREIVDDKAQDIVDAGSAARGGQHPMSVVMITGAARGIGAESAKQLLRPRPRGRARRPRARPSSRRARPSWAPRAPRRSSATSRDRVALERGVAQIVERFGGIDVVIANAGVATVGTVAAMDPDEFERVVEVNLLGVYRTVQAALPHVTERRGYVLVVASLAAAVHAGMMANYAMAKAGAEAFANSLRTELAPHGTDVGCRTSASSTPTWSATPTSTPPAARAPRRAAVGPQPDPASARPATRSCVASRAAGRVVYAPRWVGPMLALRGVLQPSSIEPGILARPSSRRCRRSRPPRGLDERAAADVAGAPLTEETPRTGPEAGKLHIVLHGARRPLLMAEVAAAGRPSGFRGRPGRAARQRHRGAGAPSPCPPRPRVRGRARLRGRPFSPATGCRRRS